MPPPDAGRPQADTGLPPGVLVGPLGPRVVAYLIDSAVPAVVGIVLQLLLPGLTGSTRLVASLLAVVVILGWAIVVWHGTATRAASPGMRVMSLQLVGFYDGRPVGWGRAVLRTLIFGALALTGIGLVVMLVLLLLHPRHQGWHDRAIQAVVIKARALAPKERAGSKSQLEATTGTSGPSAASAPVPSATSAGGLPPATAAGPPPATAAVSPTAAPAAAAAPAPLAPPPPLAPPTSYGPEIRYQQSETPTRSPYSPPGPRVEAPPPAPEPAPRPEEWVAKLDDGREIVIDGLVLFGRNPQPQPGEEDANLIKLADQSRTVSKSHLAVGLDGSGAYVSDRGSTNGSVVTAPDGTATRCRAGDIVPIGPGSIVSMGDHWLELSRRPIAD